MNQYSEVIHLATLEEDEEMFALSLTFASCWHRGLRRRRRMTWRSHNNAVFANVSGFKKQAAARTLTTWAATGLPDNIIDDVATQGAVWAYRLIWWTEVNKKRRENNWPSGNPEYGVVKNGLDCTLHRLASSWRVLRRAKTGSAGQTDKKYCFRSSVFLYSWVPNTYE
jgi:hypothetical protein